MTPAKLIIISGQSGSGKSYLSKLILSKYANVRIINTDSYYKSGRIIWILEKFINGFYDRIYSIKKEKLIMDIINGLKKEENNNSYLYDFKTRKSKKILQKEQNEYSILIVEGIFAHLLPENIINKAKFKILCTEKREVCQNRRIKRDILYRGRSNEKVVRDFKRAWILFKKKSAVYENDSRLIRVNTSNACQINKLLEKIEKLNLNYS